MVEKKKVKQEEDKPDTNTYFGRRQVTIEKICEGKTKDEQIKWLKHELADVMTICRISLDSWKKSLDSWRHWNMISLICLIIVFLLGLVWGILLFT